MDSRRLIPATEGPLCGSVAFRPRHLEGVRAPGMEYLWGTADLLSGTFPAEIGFPRDHPLSPIKLGYPLQQAYLVGTR
jgi:hypothetical protein